VTPWTQAKVAIKGIWVASRAALFICAIGFGVVQTVRLEGLKVWPVEITGWRPLAIERGETIASFAAAQDQALKDALAAKAKAEADYRTLAERIDDEDEQARAGAMDDAERYIAGNRVQRCPADRGAAGGASTDHGTSGGDAAGPPAIVDAAGAGIGADLVAVTADDVRICTANTLQAEAARSWALDLVRESER
jgi:hypothetical protein